MFCIRCQREVYECICPDIEERLRSIQDVVAQAMCTKCHKHVDRCICYLENGERPPSEVLIRK
jgi:hypothetical protein